ncbi:hormone-sensitive lipase isoform X2 [Bacillus rossius redtenbacheri]|uniref:hormone-sensitive lipase isoform X2 n=1 Tax=Bacillus rossius redtenbacheri TaxID=93214 RepID=UPI002FDD9193
MSAADDLSAPFELASPAFAMYQLLKELCLNNAEFFRRDDSEGGQRLHAGFLAVGDHVGLVAPLVHRLRRVAPSFDFNSSTPGNGYRSFNSVVDMCVVHGVKLCRQICDGRDSFLFRKSHYAKEVEACGHLLASLGSCLQLLQTMLSWGRPGELFSPEAENHTAEELLRHTEAINMYCFYGRCLGFQYCESMQKILKTISIMMASFSELYYSRPGLLSQATATLVTGGRYLLDPELRARRLVNISQYATVDFCKSFWLLSEMELLGRVPGMVCPAVAVNKVISIPPEPLEHARPDGSRVAVPIPDAHIGTAPVQARLLSAARREGMMGEGRDARGQPVLPPSSALVIHCHGGGFVSQSSHSHEMYLREWACQLGVPVLSVDYSLAPRAPFPRALQEVLYAYCWALHNAHLLGSTAEKVVLVGDSAGANLNLGVAMKCVELGLRRPDGLFLAYVPVLVSFLPSPSRLLCIMDPLLPFGFMMRCLKAYACPGDGAGSPRSSASGKDDTESFEEVSESDLLELAAHKSAVSGGGSDTLTTVSLASLGSRPEADQSPEEPASARPEADGMLDRYVLRCDTDSQGREVPVLTTEPGGDEQVLFEAPCEPGLSARLGLAVSSLTSSVANTLGLASSRKPAACWQPREHTAGSRSPVAQLDALHHRSPSEEFQFQVPKDPYLSPYYASDDVLRQLPPTSILSLQLDPCLDDCVMFARRLDRLGCRVSLDVVDGLPHGFLNFSAFSKEAHGGSMLCVKRIRDLLGLARQGDGVQ